MKRLLFEQVVHKGGFLKNIPFLPHVFDAWLKLHAFIFNPSLMKRIDRIEQRIEFWDGVEVLNHKYGGLQFNYKRLEVGHVHSNGLLDIKFSRSRRDALIAEGLAEAHHVFKQSGWISYWIHDDESAEHALSLLRESYLGKRKELL